MWYFPRVIAREFIFSTFNGSTFRYCARAKELLNHLQVDAKIIELNQIDNGHIIQRKLGEKFTQSFTVPSIWFSGKWFGGSDKLMQAYNDESLQALLKQNNIPFTPEKVEL